MSKTRSCPSCLYDNLSMAPGFCPRCNRFSKPHRISEVLLDLIVLTYERVASPVFLLVIRRAFLLYGLIGLPVMLADQSGEWVAPYWVRIVLLLGW